MSPDNNRLFLLAISLSILPIWLVDYPPLVDLPQHAAQVSTLREIFKGNPAFTGIFEINWFMPYLMGYLSVCFFTLFAPIVVAEKIVISIAVFSMPLLSRQLFREVGSDQRWAWLVIPSSISFAFYWGFINYLVAMPLGLLFLIFTIRFNDNPSPQNTLLIALYSVLLFFCHVLVLGYISLIALSYLVGANYKDCKTLIKRCLPYATPLPLIIVWLISTQSSEAQISYFDVKFNLSIGLRSREIIAYLSGSDDTSLNIAMLFSVLVLALPFVNGAKFNRHPQRWLPLVVGIVTFSFFPAVAFGTVFLYERFGAFLALLWFMVWDRPEKESSLWQSLVILTVCLWAMLNIYRFYLYDRETQHFDQIMSAMEPGRRALSMMVVKRSPYFATPIYLHFPFWYQATQQGTVDPSFAGVFPAIVRYRADKDPEIHPSFTWNLDKYSWDQFRGDYFHYFIVHSETDRSLALFRGKRHAVRRVAQSGSWWLYEKTGN